MSRRGLMLGVLVMLARAAPAGWICDGVDVSESDRVVWFGAGHEAYIEYDGSNLVVEPDSSGAGALVVDGETQLGRASTDNHGINTAQVADRMMTEDFDDASTAADTKAYGRHQTVDHSAVIGGSSPSTEHFGRYLDQNVSGDQTTGYLVRKTYGDYIEVEDTSGYGVNNDQTAENVGQYIDVGGTPGTLHSNTTYRRYGSVIVVGGDLATVGSARQHYGLRTTVSGTAQENYAGWFSAAGATANYGVWVDAGDVVLDNDAQKLYVGEAQDASIFYDGADLIVDPAEAGSGRLLVGASGTAHVQSGRLYLNATDYLYTDGTNLLWSDN